MSSSSATPMAPKRMITAIIHQKRRSDNTKMEFSATTWLASTGTNFYISPWGHIWKKHRVEKRRNTIARTWGFILSATQRKGEGRQQLEHSLLALCKTKENAALHPLNFLQKQWQVLSSLLYFPSPSTWLPSRLTSLPSQEFVPEIAEGYFFLFEGLLSVSTLRNWQKAKRQ